MLVYRYENAEGGGPFNDALLSWDFTEAMLENGLYPDAHPRRPSPWHNRFPTPWEDGISTGDCRDMQDPRCGCSSLEQLNRWFPEPCAEVARKNGFDIVTYEVPPEHVAIGDEQVVFDAAFAERGATLPVAA